jgi:hypothetical protein
MGFCRYEDKRDKMILSKIEDEDDERRRISKKEERKEK